MTRPRTPNQIGKDAEQRAIGILNGRVVGGSGNGKWLKGDGRDAGLFVYFIKATVNIRTTWARAILKLWDEAVKGTRGAAGHGDGARPALIFELEGDLFILARLEDYAELATGELSPYVEPSKAQQRRRRHMLPPSQR